MHLVLNLGQKSPCSTFLADGLNGLTPHLENRASFVVIALDDLLEMHDFAKSRNWQFRIYSDRKPDFRKDMSFVTKDGALLQGVLVFFKKGSMEQIIIAWIFILFQALIFLLSGI